MGFHKSLTPEILGDFMNLFSLILAVSVLSSTAFAVEKMAYKPAMQTSVSTTAATTPNVLAFNFIGLARGHANIYFDIGGVSELVSPSLSYRSSSSAESRKSANDNILTVDRSLVTLGASITTFQRENKSLIVSPYLLFGTEKDALGTTTMNGIGTRVFGQLKLNPKAALQAGVDFNNMESAFKGDIYVGLGLSI
jgi:hypothetical protein